MRTIAEKIKARGKREGKQEGKLELVLAQLALRFGKLPPHIAQRVGNGTPAELDHWAARLLTAPTLDAVFAPAKK